MDRNVDEQVVKNFELYYPLLAEDVVKYLYDHVFGELIFILRDGATWVYEDVDNSIYRLPDDWNNMTDTEFKTEFGRRLKKLMFKKHILQDELAERTGMSQQQISSYICGKTIPTFINVDKIARALDCSVDDLRCI